jgi:GNAT superfamily N-acetyltransferase
MTGPSFEIREVSTVDTFALRHSVLRPHQSIDDCQYPGDNETTTFHVGAVKDKTIIGIATVLRDVESRYQKFDSEQQMRLRGMAVAPDQQGQGIGRAILNSCLEIAQQRDCRVFWCNARLIAVDFYLAAGFQILNDETFEIEGIGPHHVMFKKLNAPS